MINTSVLVPLYRYTREPVGKDAVSALCRRTCALRVVSSRNGLQGVHPRSVRVAGNVYIHTHRVFGARKNIFDRGAFFTTERWVPSEVRRSSGVSWHVQTIVEFRVLFFTPVNKRKLVFFCGRAQDNCCASKALFHGCPRVRAYVRHRPGRRPLFDEFSR